MIHFIRDFCVWCVVFFWVQSSCSLNLMSHVLCLLCEAKIQYDSMWSGLMFQCICWNALNIFDHIQFNVSHFFERHDFVHCSNATDEALNFIGEINADGNYWSFILYKWSRKKNCSTTQVIVDTNKTHGLHFRVDFVSYKMCQFIINFIESNSIWHCFIHASHNNPRLYQSSFYNPRLNVDDFIRI